MNDDPLQARYTTGAYEIANPDWHEEDAAWKAAQVISLLHSNSIMPQSLCDVGCGSGGVLAELSKGLGSPCAMFGYDIASTAIALAVARHKESGVTFRSTKSIAEIKGYFDLVLVLDVFEHVENYIGFLREIRRLGDQFIFHIPLDISIQTIWNQELIMTRRRSVGHLHHFCRSTAIDTLVTAGYDVRVIRYTPSGMIAPPYSWRNSIRRYIIKTTFRAWPNRTVDLFGGYSLLVLAATEPTQIRRDTTEPDCN